MDIYIERHNVKTFILIGGIGSGKSTVRRMLADCGAAVIDLDQLNKTALVDSSVQQALVQEFGERIIVDGALSSAALAQLAFETQDATQRLDAIMHPVILSLALQAIDTYTQADVSIAIVEASAYAGPGSVFDTFIDSSSGIIAVVAPEDVRLARAMRSGFTEGDVRLRMKRQPTDVQRREWADYVIDNDGTLDQLAGRVAALWEWMKER